MASPIFTVILATYNRAELLGRAITSILGQTFSDFELLVIDDGSSDQTNEVIAAFADPRLHTIRQTSNGGVSTVRNLGIKEAAGAYLAFIDDDDTVEPTYLAEVYAALVHAPPEVGFLWTWKYIVVQTTTGIHRTALYTYDIHHQRPLPGCDYLGKLRPGSGGLVVRASAMREIGGFNPEFRTQEDTELLLRLAERFDYVVVPQPLYSIFQHPGERLTRRSLARIQTTARITELHYHTFVRYPELLSARYYAIGREHYRFGDRRIGQEYLRKAIAYQPTNLHYRLRLLLFECFSYLPIFVQQKIMQNQSKPQS